MAEPKWRLLVVLLDRRIDGGGGLKGKFLCLTGSYTRAITVYSEHHSRWLTTRATTFFRNIARVDKKVKVEINQILRT